MIFIIKDGFWIKLWMESGRGQNTLSETFQYLKYEDGYTREDTEMLDDLAYEWTYYEKCGRDLTRFKSGFDIVNPPKEWIMSELKTTKIKIERLIEYRSRLLFGSDII